MKNDDYREKAFHNEFCEFDNFNSNEIFFTPSSYSLMHLNQDNKNDIHNEINTKMNISQLNPYYSSNNNQTNFSSPELLKPLMPFIQFNQNDINFYPSTDYQFNNTNSNSNTTFQLNLFNTLRAFLLLQVPPKYCNEPLDSVVAYGQKVLELSFDWSHAHRDIVSVVFHSFAVRHRHGYRLLDTNRVDE